MEISSVADDIPRAAVATESVLAVRWLRIVAEVARGVVVIAEIFYLKKVMTDMEFWILLSGLTRNLQEELSLIEFMNH
jgi:hypothetical protein